jgi:hypothetical protein
VKWLLLLLLLPASAAAQQVETVTTTTRSLIPRPPAVRPACPPDSVQRAQLAALMARLAQQERGGDRTLRRVTAVAAVTAAIGVLILVFRAGKDDGKDPHWPRGDDDADKQRRD